MIQVSEALFLVFVYSYILPASIIAVSYVVYCEVVKRGGLLGIISNWMMLYAIALSLRERK